ncbi:CRISPR-associated endonuclease/helicase Cas3 [Actinoalloteichus hymeniacidonis]|nr:CRISPR-associated endonuclease/helicase Cas3 [Actinoalloteichus hymeniacidonis]
MNAPDLGELLGLCHDAGKCFNDWQRRFLAVGGRGRRHGRVGIPHADVGAHLLRDAAGPAALAVLGHHKGLTTVAELADLPANPDQAARFAEAQRAFLRAVPRAEDLLNRRDLIPAEWRENRSLRDMGLRLVYSALVDADYLDTSAFMAPTEVRTGEDLTTVNLLARFDEARTSRALPISELNLLRDDIYEQAVQSAELPAGMYRLTAGTGTGKTLTSTGFALNHARKHGHRRVIMVVPFITITRQNAEVLKSKLGAESVLEHHSAVDLPNDSWTKLATENWDAPFIVTTTVQFFQSIFARRPGPMRKLHRIARSVIILDEVQALPATMLVPILDALRILVEHFGCTVLLCSATQPTFDRLPIWRKLTVKDIVTVPKTRLERARTVRFRYWSDPRPTWDEVAQDAATHDQALLIVNTRADARDLYSACQRAAPEHRVLHISRNMCDRHVMATFESAKKALGRNEKLLLVTTQLVEAGVDIDFPTVYRAWATAEAHLQSAGRCNREGNRSEGLVIIFDPAGGRLPAGYYRVGAEVARRHFGPAQANPDNLDALSEYFGEVFHYLKLDSQGFPRNKQKWEHWHHVTHNRSRLNFRDVADGVHRFQMIDEDSVPVVISSYRGPIGETALEHLAEIRAAVGNAASAAKPTRLREAIRALQPYTVSLSKSSVRRAEERGDLVPIITDVLYGWTGGYSQQTGIDI